MDKSAALMGLTFVTLVLGLAFGFYQMWSVEKSKQKGTHSAMSERRQPGSTVGNPHAAASNQDMASKEDGQRYVAAAERAERVTEMNPLIEGLAADDEAKRIDKVRVVPRSRRAGTTPLPDSTSGDT